MNEPLWPPPPKPLYKFVERRWRDAFFETGSLRLGTVYDYRRTEKYGQARGDELDGIHKVVRRGEGGVKITRDEPLYGEVFPEGSIVFGIDVVAQRTAEDAYIFCTTHEVREAMFKRWYDEEQLDACYQIFDLPGFARAIGAAIKNRITDKFWAGRCFYRGEPTDYRDDFAEAWPGQVKPLRYEWQKEARIVWHPRPEEPKPIGPLNILVPEARKFCRPFATLESGRVRYDRPARRTR